MTQQAESKLAVCYNGACPVCSAAVRHSQRIAATAPDGALSWHDFTADAEIFTRHGVDFDAALRRFHVVGRDGKLYSGVDAFLLLWREMPYYRRLAALIRLPVARHIATLVYDYVLVPPLYRWNKRRLRKRPPRSPSPPSSSMAERAG